MRRRGFTVIELLVVVSIVALLIALLLPTMGTARDMAKATKCLSQERQFFVGIMAYASDHAGCLPISSYAYCSHSDVGDPWYPADHNAALWSAVVAHYTGNKYITEFPTNAAKYPNEAKFPGYYNVPKKNQGILKCPSESFTNFWGCDLAVSYGYNGHGWGLGVNDFFVFHWQDYYSGNRIYNDIYGRLRVAQVLKPRDTVMVADENQEGGYEYRAYHLNTGPLSVATYHRGKGNILWADGHASTRDPATMTDDDFDRR